MINAGRTLFSLMLGLCLFISGAALGETTHSGSLGNPNALPDIGNPEDRYLSPREEFELGSGFFRELQRQNLILDDPELSNYIQSLGNRLTSGIGNYHFRFFVIRDYRINAFAVPGGFIGINAGLILASRNEGELASVVAHEIAHVTQRHIARFYSKTSGSGWAILGSIIASIALASQGQGEAAIALQAGTTASLYQNAINHTRAHEKEADRVGIQYLAQAGFNPMDMAGFFDVIRNKTLEADTRFEILQTHPLSANRVAEARARGEQLGNRPVPSSLLYLQSKARLVALASDQGPLLNYYKNTQKNLSDMDRYTYAQLLTQEGDYADASKLLAQLSNTYIDNINFQLAEVRVLLANGKAAEARKHLEALLLIYPNYMPIVVYYAQTLKTLGDHKLNAQLIQNFHHEDPDMPIQLYTLWAESLDKLGQKGRSQYIQGEYFFRKGQYRAASLQLRGALKSEELNVRETQAAEKLQEEIDEARKRLR